MKLYMLIMCNKENHLNSYFCGNISNSSCTYKFELKDIEKGNE